MQIPEVVSFRITSKCQFNCKFCLATRGFKDLNLKLLIKIFNKLKKAGIKSILLCGGEPLIRKDIVEILKTLKKKDFTIFLDTNGMDFFKYKNEINRYVSTIGLPIDHSIDKKSYRSAKQFNNIIKILEYYKNKKKKPYIRIGTVANKENINDLENIAGLLLNYKIDIWKIYEFIPEGENGIKNRKELVIDSKRFFQLKNKLKRKYKNLNIIFSSRKSRDKAYFLIRSNGQVFIPVDKNICEEVIIGKIFDKDIFKKWQKYVDVKNHKNNIKVTFKK